MKEKQNEEYLIEEKKPEQLSRSYRLLIFLILYLISIIIRYDQTIFSQQKKETKDKQFNFIIMLCSSFGQLIGYIAFIFISQIENRKKVAFICFLLYGILYLTYSLSYNNWVSYCSKFILSFIRCYPTIFVVVWIDQFFMKKYKTLFMYLFNTLDFPINIIIIHFKDSKWYVKGITFGIIVIILDCLLLLFPEKYFSLKYSFIGYKKDGKEEINTNVVNSEKVSLYKNEYLDKKANQQGLLKSILKNNVYIFSVLALIIYNLVYFVFQMHILNHIMKVDNFDNIFKLQFMLNNKTNSSTASFVCMIFGGICLLYIGGYENKKSAFYLGICTIISFFCISMIAFTDNSTIFSIGFYLFVSIRKSYLIILMCFIINFIPNKYKGSGVSLFFTLDTIIKYFSLTIYDKLEDFFGKINPTLPWKIFMSLFYFAVIFSLLSSYYRYKSHKDNDEIKNDNEIELEDIQKK